MLAALKISDFMFSKRELGIQNIPIDEIRPNPYLPRRIFDKKALEELAASIEEYGVMHPISVRFINGCSYELVSGERRLRAAQMTGMHTIPAVIVNISDYDSAMMAMIENVQRRNLNYLEEAEGYQNLMLDYGITEEELGEKLGKSPSFITDKLRILKLSQDMKRLLLENELTERHARALLKIPDEEIRRQIFLRVIEEELNSRKTEELVESVLNKLSEESEGKRGEQRIRRQVKDMRLFTNTIKKSVEIIRKSGVPASYDLDEKEHYYEIKIKIPIQG